MGTEANAITLIPLMQIIIPSSITILGLLITFLVTKRSIKAEVEKQKLSKLLEKTADLPMEILALIDALLDKESTENTSKRFKQIMAQVLAFGSIKAVQIVTRAQEHVYNLNPSSSDFDRKKVISFYILLICQLKFDITGTKINPSLWYRMRMKDYPEQKAIYTRANNSIVDDIELDSFLRIS